MNEMIDVSVAVAAPKEAAWAVLADYGNVHAYVRGILDAYLTTEQASGVGMTRYCALPPMMMMKQYIVEEITAWDEGRSFTYIITDAAAPIADASVAWSVEGNDRRSRIRARVSYRPKGVMGRLMAPMMRKQSPKQMNAALADMKQHLEARVIGHAKAA
jgi:carbon monoxide dehydrogenase subunit G